MKRIAQVLVFAVCISMITWTMLRPAPTELTKPLPQGWELVRPPHDVSTMLVEADEVWAGGMEGVWVVDRRTRLARPAFADGNGPRHIHALLRDRDGSLLVGHDGGLMRCVNGRTTKVDLPASLTLGKVLSLLITHNGALWVGTDRGAAVIEGNAWHVLHAVDGLASDVVNTMTEDKDGGIWLGSYNVPAGGVSLFSAGRWHRWTPVDGLPHASVTSLFQDRDSRIWAGTGLMDRGGLASFEMGDEGWRLVRVLHQTDGLAGAKVRSLFEDRSGRLWAGSEYDGIAVRDPSGWKIRRAADGLAHDEIKAIGQDSDGAVWLGTKDGLTVICEQAW